MKSAIPFAALVLGGGAVFAGYNSLSGATQGVGYVCIGCFLGIAARVIQAAIQHAELLKSR